MAQDNDRHTVELEERIAELEDTLRQRDRRIAELTEERDNERELVSKLREYHEDAHAMIESWIEGFDMVMDDKGEWGWDVTWEENYYELLDKYIALEDKWNKFVPKYNATVAPTLRNFGRQLLASPAQKADVLKRRKAGQSFRAIADETGLSVRTVRTIDEKADGVDRATLARLKKIAPDRAALAKARRSRKTHDAMPGQVNAMIKRDSELRKKLKGR